MAKAEPGAAVVVAAMKKRSRPKLLEAGVPRQQGKATGEKGAMTADWRERTTEQGPRNAGTKWGREARQQCRGAGVFSVVLYRGVCAETKPGQVPWTVGLDSDLDQEGGGRCKGGGRRKAANRLTLHPSCVHSELPDLKGTQTRHKTTEFTPEKTPAEICKRSTRKQRK